MIENPMHLGTVPPGGRFPDDFKPAAGPLDPWAHRSSGMRCSTCMWWAPKGVPLPVTGPNDRGQLGRCRRHAPTMSGFPAVFQADWCGDHKLDETRL